MPRGGKRAGAGRPKGAKSVLTEKAIQEAGEGITPLEFMLTILRDDTLKTADRFEAAKAAAPYMHARQMESKIKSENVNFNVSDEPMTEEQWESEFADANPVEASTGAATRLN